MNEAKELRAKAEFWVRLCALPRYSFIVKNNGLARIEDRVGSLVELHEVMKIVDAAQEKIDELTAELNCRAQPAAQAVPGTAWIRLADRMPNPDEHRRVLIYTEGYDFGGQQVFDVKAEDLNEWSYQYPEDQPEECRLASHWAEHPAQTGVNAAPTPPAGEARRDLLDWAVTSR